MIKPVLHGVMTEDHHDLRAFVPEDPQCVLVHLVLCVGQRRKKGTDDFVLLVATPKGLAVRTPRDDGTLASGRMLVVPSYDYDMVWRWLEHSVASCEAPTWEGCVERLRNRFRWEFEEYREGP